MGRAAERLSQSLAGAQALSLLDCDRLKPSVFPGVAGPRMD